MIPNGIRIEHVKSNKVAKREIKIHYKTNDMLKPKLKYKIDEKTGDVACLASFVPTFQSGTT